MMIWKRGLDDFEGSYLPIVGCYFLSRGCGVSFKYQFPMLLILILSSLGWSSQQLVLWIYGLSEERRHIE